MNLEPRSCIIDCTFERGSTTHKYRLSFWLLHKGGTGIVSPRPPGCGLVLVRDRPLYVTRAMPFPCPAPGYMFNLFVLETVAQARAQAQASEDDWRTEESSRTPAPVRFHRRVNVKMKSKPNTLRHATDRRGNRHYGLAGAVNVRAAVGRHWDPVQRGDGAAVRDRSRRYCCASRCQRLVRVMAPLLRVECVPHALFSTMDLCPMSASDTHALSSMARSEGGNIVDN